MKRVFLIVLDSFGIGQMADAELFGDKNCNTLARVSSSKKCHIPNLIKMGLGNIDGVSCLEQTKCPTALYARLSEKSMGKDTTIGHWEIAGLISQNPMPTYPDGFPATILEQFSKEVGRGILCNQPYSGTQVIADFGEEHLKTGDLIVYTSADSVFQIAAHESIVPLDQLYDYCRMARKLLQGEHGVGRVIARPFTGEAPSFTRTANRKDFSLPPFTSTMLDAVVAANKKVYSVGKISDIFAGQGISHSYPTHSNTEGMKMALELQKEEFEGLCFINLVDFDMLYGHRQDIDGYAAALSAFDAWIPSLLEGMKQNDLLMITADHGCDPGDDSTDHTREYTPFLCFGQNVDPTNLGTRETFADIAATVTKYLEVPFDCIGTSMI